MPDYERAKAEAGYASTYTGDLYDSRRHRLRVEPLSRRAIRDTEHQAQDESDEHDSPSRTADD